MHDCDTSKFPEYTRTYKLRSSYIIFIIRIYVHDAIRSYLSNIVTYICIVSNAVIFFLQLKSVHAVYACKL